MLGKISQCSESLYLAKNRMARVPEEILLSQLLAHLVQLLDELADGPGVKVGVEALDVDQILLVLVHVVIAGPVLPLDRLRQLVHLLHLAAGKLLQFSLS